MWFWWFLLSILFFILWLIARARGKNGADKNNSYAQGYWDGYRALGAKVRDAIAGPEISRDRLNDLVNEGQQPSVSSAYTAYVEAVPRPSVPFVAVSPEDLLLQKQTAAIRNLNTILYMASFLLVAAAAAFVAAAMSPAIRLIGLWAVVVLFYGAGYVLYSSIPRLRPAAAAFLGTGLAILPFAGIALNMLGGTSGPLAWTITSLVGVLAYTAAAVLLQSQLVSYLTMAFVLSLASSFAATAGAPFVWYFVILIGVSLIANLVSFLRPSWLPELFHTPIESTGQLVTPLALLASLFVADKMTATTYEVVFGLATAHYLVVWLQQQTVLYETLVRALGQVTLLIVAWDVTGGDYQTFGVWWLVLAALQVVYSLLRVRPADQRSLSRESLWLMLAMAAYVLGLFFWQTHTHAAAWTLVSLIVIGLSSLATTLRLRDVRWAVVGLAASLAIPFVVARWLVQPVLPWGFLATTFTLLAGAMTGSYYYGYRYRSLAVRTLFALAFGLYGAAAIFSALSGRDASVIGWTFAGLAALTAVLSYIGRVVMNEVIAGLLGFVAIAAWLSDTSIDSRWYVTALAVVSAGLVYTVTFVHHFLGEVSRRNALLALGQVYLGLLVLNWLGGDSVVMQASLMVLIAATLVSFGLRVASRTKSTALQSVFVYSYFSYLLLAWLMSFRLEAGWSVLVYVVGALLLWLASYVEKLPGLVIVGNVALTVAVAILWHWLKFDPAWQVFGVVWIVAAILYGAYWACVYQGDVWRQRACLWSVWVLLGVAILAKLNAADTVQQLAAAATIIVGSGTLAIQGYLSKSDGMVEAGIYVATFGLQRIVGITIPETNIVFYSHWWAITLGLVAWWRGGTMTTRLIIAMAFITFGSGVMALSEGGGYQVLFLVEHLALLVIGALLSKTWAIWWGIAASALAVMYFLKDYLFLWLGFLGLLLIGIVVWRLVRMNTKN